MSIKFRLTLMNFLQFFIWGSWLITISAYWFQNKQWSGADFGELFSTLGISSIIMPAFVGIIADKWINAERLLGLLHILGAITLFCLPMVNDPKTMYWVMLINMCCYMPTISLANAVSYAALKSNNYDVVKVFPPIRVWGTIGFIIAMWTVSLLHFETSAYQFYVASAAALILGIYSFTLPKCPPQVRTADKKGVLEKLGLEAIGLFKQYKMAMFFFFAMLLGAALQLTNMYGDTFLHDFNIPKYADTITVKYPAIIMSISQISETLFILAIPFFLKRFGIKNVMLISMFAWVIRFGLFAYCDPAGGLWMIVLSCIVYGMAFDFFNISGSLFVETETDPKIRASAQGLFMMATNGIGAFLGSKLSGWMIDKYFTTAEGAKNWHGIWITFAIYSLIVAVLFAVLFRHAHKRNQISTVSH
jgi:NHS family xanthosine MFS transporter